jgi:myo-inositol catabolism protein IolC
VTIQEMHSLLFIIVQMGHNHRHTERLLVHTTAVFYSLDWWKLWPITENDNYIW